MKSIILFANHFVLPSISKAAPVQHLSVSVRYLNGYLDIWLFMSSGLAPPQLAEFSTHRNPNLPNLSILTFFNMSSPPTSTSTWVHLQKVTSQSLPLTWGTGPR